MSTPFYTVRAFNCGVFRVPGPEVYWMQGWGEREEMNVLMFLVQGNGHNILINTGPPEDLSELNAAWVSGLGFPEAAITRTEAQLPRNILAGEGISEADISHVIVTPLQAYATANIHRFPHAEICISRKGWIEDWQAPEYAMHVPRRLRIPPEVNNYLQNEGWEKLRLLADEEEILPGIRVFWVGAHHRSSLAVCIETVNGTVLITDCFFKYGNLEQGRYLGIMESMMEADRSWKRIRKESSRIASIYDPEVFLRYPGGVL
ncbi:MAG: hypothetical protein M3Z09_10350 [Acidobacteriota bacterium]|nr:hypothetical protein [Acidobacteriota bacterium]